MDAIIAALERNCAAAFGAIGRVVETAIPAVQVEPANERAGLRGDDMEGPEADRAMLLCKREEGALTSPPALPGTVSSVDPVRSTDPGVDGTRTR